jgi:tripartite-type tricarboxylate transporter receptor subunit TctC
MGLAGLASTARAQAWPNRVIECVVGYAPGGGVDLVMRTISPPLSARLGQTVTVVNRPGAGSIVGAQAVSRARPDGYTLLGTDGGALTLNGALFAKLPYDPQKDLAPLSLLIRSPLLLVAHPSFAPNDIRGMVEWSKREGKLDYASVGVGSYHHMAMELLKARAGFAAQDIPFKGQGPAIQEVLAGRIPVMVIGAAGLAQVTSGRLKALAVLTHQRISALPNVLTTSEQGVSDAEVYAWVGLAAPRETPRAVMSRLSDELRGILADPDMARKLQEMGYEPYHLGPDEFSAFVTAEVSRFHPLIRKLNIKLD